MGYIHPQRPFIPSYLDSFIDLFGPPPPPPKSTYSTVAEAPSKAVCVK